MGFCLQSSSSVSSLFAIQSAAFESITATNFTIFTTSAYFRCPNFLEILQ